MKKHKNKSNLAKRVCLVMQLYARLRDSDIHGFGTCCSCGQTVPWEKLEGGHFQPKGRHYNSAAFDPRNINGQCTSCNCFLQGNPAGYKTFMEEKYGPDIFEELFLMSKKIRNKEELEELLKEYRQKNRELAKEKTFEVRLY
jgi:hypothetical protein